MEVARLKTKLFPRQKYILDLLKVTRMSDCRPANTSIVPELRDHKEGDLVNITQYQKLMEN